MLQQPLNDSVLTGILKDAYEFLFDDEIGLYSFDFGIDER